MIRILNAESENYSLDAVAILKHIGQVDLQNLTREQLLTCIVDYDAVIVRLAFQVDEQLIDTAKCLKAIVSATTGVDHIDMEYAGQKGIAVLTLRGETEFLRSIPATVEHTIGLMLALIRHIPWAYQSVQDGRWDRDAFKGHDLSGQKLGILGLGRIGEKVAALAQAFGMEIWAYDPYRNTFPSFVHQAKSLSELLQQAPVFSIHTPLNEETTHLISFDELASLPPHSYLINTARGDIINERALLHALESGHLAGAALDVIPGERDREKRRTSGLVDYARRHDNLIITPHIGGATYESMAMTEVFMARKLQRFFEGRV